MNRFALLAALAALPLLAACGGGGDAPSDATTVSVRTTTVDVVEAQPGPFEDTIELTGTVAAPEDATLGAETSGTVTYIASLGQSVRAGAVVAQIDPQMARSAVAGAQAGVQSARAGVVQATAGVQAAEAQRRAAQAQLDLQQDLYRRQQPLVRDSILSAAEFRGVEAALASARAGVAQADAGIAQARGQLSVAQAGLQSAQSALQQTQTGLANTRVVAPFGGTVEAQLVERGETVSPGTPVVRLVSGGGLLVEAGVPERYAADVRVGTVARVNASGSDDARGGRVTFAGRAIDPNSRTLPIEIALDSGEGALRPAMVVRLQLSRAVLANVLTVPSTAVVRDERGTGVLVVVGDTVRHMPVRLGQAGGGRVVVTSGLDAGALVVADARTAVRAGDAVRTRRVDPDDVVALR